MSRSGANVKALFERRIFKKPPASDVTITSINTSSNTMNGYYGFTDATSSTATTVGVPYTYTGNLREYLGMGVNNDGQARVALRGDVSIKPGDSLTVAGITDVYEITEVTNLYYNEVNCGQIVTVKIQNQ